MELEKIIEEMRADGSAELDLPFSVDRDAARRLRVLPPTCDDGLVALANAVIRGATRVSVNGDNERCRLSYENVQVPLGPGSLSKILRRGVFAPLDLRVNGRRLGHGRPQALAEAKLHHDGDLLSGSISLLPLHQTGQVVLVDRGISFRLGPLLGATRMVAKVTQRRGEPWPSNLSIDSSLKQILESLLWQCQKLENRAAFQVKGRPLLLSRLLHSVRRRQRLGDRTGAARLLGLLLQNSGKLKKISR